MRRRMRLRASLVWGGGCFVCRVSFSNEAVWLKSNIWRPCNNMISMYMMCIYTYRLMYMCIASQHELERLALKRSHKMGEKNLRTTTKKEWVSPEILPFYYTLQMFVFILVVIPLQLPLAEKKTALV